MNEVLNSLPLDVAESRNPQGLKKNLDKVTNIIKHKNLMVPCALNTVKCLVEEIYLTLHIHSLCSFLVKHLLLTIVRDVTRSFDGSVV